MLRCSDQDPASLRQAARICRAYAEGASKARMRATLIEISEHYAALASKAQASLL